MSGCGLIFLQFFFQNISNTVTNYKLKLQAYQALSSLAFACQSDTTAWPRNGGDTWLLRVLSLCRAHVEIAITKWNTDS